MEINSKDFLKVMSVNFSFEIVSTCIGDAIKMSPFEAFIFANITGARYLNNNVFQFTPKGLMKTFRSAFEYDFVNGLYEGTFPKYSPLKLSSKYPFLFNEEKFVFPIEFTSEDQLSRKIKEYEKKILEDGSSPLNFIYLRIETRKKGNGMEPFLEYLVCEYFARKGFMVENQIVLTHDIGSPDFGSFKIGLCKVEKGTRKGFHIIELALLRLNKSSSFFVENIDFSAVVGEVKTSTNNVKDQIMKYMSSSLFNIGFEITANNRTASRDDLGVIYISKHHEIVIDEPIIPFSQSEDNTLLTMQYKEWIENYLKAYLLTNLTDDEINVIANRMILKNVECKSDIIEIIKNIKIVDLIDIIKGD